MHAWVDRVMSCIYFLRCLVMSIVACALILMSAVYLNNVLDWAAGVQDGDWLNNRPSRLYLLVSLAVWLLWLIFWIKLFVGWMRKNYSKWKMLEDFVSYMYTRN